MVRPWAVWFPELASGLPRWLASACGPRFHHLRILAQTDHVGENPIGAGNSLGHLAVESVGVIDVNALAVFRVDEAAFLGSLARIVRFEQRNILRVPTLKKFRATLFEPVFKILGGDFVGPRENRV